MIKKYKFHIITAGVIVLAVAIMMSGNGGELEKELAGQKRVEQETTLTLPESSSGDSLHGFLRVSENPELGNYVLASEHGDVYIRTQRDFSALAGTHVTVAIDGTPESFRLLDIHAHLE